MEFDAYKMDGLGNDFVIIDQRSRQIELSKDQIIKICNRKFIGCDQLIFIQNEEKSSPRLEFFNSDGSISGACGNGTRCAAQILSRENNEKEVEVKTLSGILNSKIFDNNIVETEIGTPKTNWDEIPLNKNLDTINLNIKILSKSKKELRGGTAINVGNPHVIFFVNNLEDYDISKIGPEIENHELFPEKINVTLASVVNKNLIKINVWERGAGNTKACGTAACATAVAGKINGLTENNVDIEFLKGKLSIKIDEKNSIHMTGPVSDIKEINVKL